MANVTITLGRDGMGDDASESDFQAWVAYVVKHIEHLGNMTGFDCVVEEHRQGDAQETRIDADDDVDDKAIWDEIESLWADFCADDSAWPARA